jgi:hypothetical protein
MGLRRLVAYVVSTISSLPMKWYHRMTNWRRQGPQPFAFLVARDSSVEIVAFCVDGVLMSTSLWIVHTWSGHKRVLSRYVGQLNLLSYSTSSRQQCIHILSTGYLVRITKIPYYQSLLACSGANKRWLTCVHRALNRLIGPLRVFVKLLIYYVVTK